MLSFRSRRTQSSERNDTVSFSFSVSSSLGSGSAISPPSQQTCDARAYTPARRGTLRVAHAPSLVSCRLAHTAPYTVHATARGHTLLYPTHGEGWTGAHHACAVHRIALRCGAEGHAALRRGAFVTA
jgi:hypothetical protein